MSQKAGKAAPPRNDIAEEPTIARALARLQASRTRGVRLNPVFAAAFATIEDALRRIDFLRNLISEIEELAHAAGAGDEITRALVAERYDDLRAGVAAALEACPPVLRGMPPAIALPTAAGKANWMLSRVALTVPDEGFGLPAPETAMADDAEIAAIAAAAEAARARLDEAARRFADDAAALVETMPAARG